MNVDLVLEACQRKDLPLGPTDWYYKNLVPKRPEANEAFRKEVRRFLRKKPSYAYDLQCICARDILFEMNVFGWTHAVMDYPSCPVRPFITRPYQDKAILLLQHALGHIDPKTGDELQNDVAFPKVREMGATWMCVCAMEHRWRHLPLQSFLCVSRKEKLVVSPDDMKAILTKWHWYTSNLPGWLQPENWKPVWGERYIVNEDNDSVVSGEATVKNVGVGDRRTGILLDEFSEMPYATIIEGKTRDTTGCRIFNSTPNGRVGDGEAFFKIISSKSNDTLKLFMHWADDARKRRGLYHIDENKKKKKFPKDWKWQDSYDFTTYTFKQHETPRSRWSDAQASRGAMNKRLLDQNMNLSFNKPGKSAFDDAEIMELMSKYAAPPTTYGNLQFFEDDRDYYWKPEELLDRSNFLLWISLDPSPEQDGRKMWNPPMGEFVIGADIAAGSGGKDASPSCLVIINAKTGKQVGRYTTRKRKPDRFGVYAVAVAKWFHNAKIVHEAAGPNGKMFLDAIRGEEYGNVHMRLSEESITTEFKQSYGVSNQDGGKAILTRLETGMRRKHVLIYDEMVYREIMEYVDGPNSSIVHSGVRSKDIESESQKTHGDVAIAAGCAFEGFRSEISDEDDDSVEAIADKSDDPYWKRYLERTRAMEGDPDKIYV